MKINEGFVKRKVGDSYLVVTTGELSKESNIMIEMNETSSEIWDYIEEGLAMPEIARKLAEKHKISMVKALYDVSKLIDKMKKAGVISE